MIKCLNCNIDITNQEIIRNGFCSKKCKKLNYSKEYYASHSKKFERNRICVWCYKPYTAKKDKQFCCCKKCIQDYRNDKVRKKKGIENQEKYKNVKDIPTCKICGWKSMAIASHIIQFHKTSIEDYKTTFNCTDNDIYHSTYLEFYSNKILGDKNPAFNHGGKFSPFSKKFIKYDSLEEHQKDETIQVLVNKTNNTKMINSSYNTKIDYYLKKGLTEKEAKIALSERQTTFSLNICIEKYGEEKGKEIWNKRQQKWQIALDNLSDEEKKRIYYEKMYVIKNSYSFISQELFTNLDIPNAFYGKNEKKIWLNNNKYVSPDFILGNKIIEFYGNFWHANPVVYSYDDKMNFPKRGSYDIKTAQEIWDKDTKRIDALKNNGYEVLIIWEREYKLNKKGTIEKCLNFLK